MANIYKILSRMFPQLEDKLIQAQMEDSPEYFIKKIWVVSLFSSIVISFFVIGPFLFTFGKSMLIAVISFPVLWLLLFLYFLRIPDVKIIRIEKNITKEIAFALRFLIIELESGGMIYEAFENMRNNYTYVGKYFGDVIDKINYGTSIEEALNETIRLCPSESLRKVFVQILNSMKTGSDIGKALEATLKQILRENNIMINEYAKKLNPFAMFYMIIAVIFPSIGFMMIVIVSSFVGFEVDFTVLMILVSFIVFMQFIFLTVIKSLRPPVEV